MPNEIAIGYALIVDRPSMDPNATKLDGGLLAHAGAQFHIYRDRACAPTPLDFERLVRVEIRSIETP